MDNLQFFAFLRCHFILRLPFHQIRKGKRFQIIRDDPVQTLPERKCPAIFLSGALLPSRLQTGHRHQRSLHQFDNGFYTVFLRRPAQPVTAAFSPHCSKKPPFYQLLHHNLKIFFRNFLTHSHIPQRHKTVLLMFCNIQRP